MNTRDVVAWLPIRTPAWDRPDRLQVYEFARDQFMAQLPEVLCALDPDLIIHGVKLSDAPSELIGWFKKKSFMNGTRQIEYISIQASVNVDDVWLKANPDIEELYVLNAAASQLADKVELVLILSELAYPGCIDTLEGACLSAGLLVEQIREKCTYTHLTFPEENDPVWPPTEMVDLRTIVGWAKRTNMSARHIAETRVERLGRVLPCHRFVVVTRWRRIVPSNAGAGSFLFGWYWGPSAATIREGSAMARTVGEQQEYRRPFVRSSIILRSWIRTVGVLEPGWWFAMYKFDTSVKFATRLLVATLQRCAKEGVIDMKWSYSFTTAS